MNRLSKQIRDSRLLELILKFLKAVSIPHPVKSKSKSKSLSSNLHLFPAQGGILSPLLSNLVFSELDEYIENLIVKSEQGKSIAQNPEYSRIQHQMNKIPVDFEFRMPLRLQLNTKPS